MNRLSVALIGANGYVGSALLKALRLKPQLDISAVTRENYGLMREQTFDYLINSAMPAKRFWAKNNPALDFKETVEKTADLFYTWHYKKFIQISSVSARTEPASVYGRHKAAAELIIQGAPHLIIRLSAMYSRDLAKGALYDILHDHPVYVSGDSRYPFVSLDFAAAWIADHLDEEGTIEVGAQNSISLKEIAAHLNKKTVFSGPKEDQTLIHPLEDFPRADALFKFLDDKLKDSI